MAYDIVIRNKTDAARKSPIAGSGTAAKDIAGDNSGEGAAALRQSAAKGLVAVNTYIRPFVDQMATQRITTISLRTGAQELEERMSFKMQVGQKIYGFATSIATGALVGGGIGAVVGGVISLATMAIDYGNKKEKLDLQRGVENIGLRYMNTRAGGSVASFSGSRLKNQ